MSIRNRLNRINCIQSKLKPVFKWPCIEVINSPREEQLVWHKENNSFFGDTEQLLSDFETFNKLPRINGGDASDFSQVLKPEVAHIGQMISDKYNYPTVIDDGSNEW